MTEAQKAEVRRCKVCGKRLRKVVPLCFDHLDLLAKRFSRWLSPEPPEPEDGVDFYVEHEYTVSFWASGAALVWAHEDEIHEREDEVFSDEIEWDDVEAVERRPTGRTRRMTFDEPPVEFDEDGWRKERVEELRRQVLGENRKLPGLADQRAAMVEEAC